MVPVIQKLCPPGRYGIKCPYTRRPRFVVVHNTGNIAPAKNEVAYMINRGEEISFHYAVDDQEIVQGLPLERNAWASGDDNGDGNMYGIHIEICYSNYRDSDPAQVELYKPKFLQAERNAAELIALLLKHYGWSLDQVKKHQDYDGKYCPHRTLDLGWQRFLNMVRGEMDKLNESKEGTEMTKAEIEKLVEDKIAPLSRELEKLTKTYNTPGDVPLYWREDIQAMIEAGVIKGSGDKLGLTRSEAKAAVIVWRATKAKGGPDNA